MGKGFPPAVGLAALLALAGNPAFAGTSSGTDILQANFVPETAPPIVQAPDPGFADGLFGYRALPPAITHSFPRWQKVIDRFVEQRANPAPFCVDGSDTTCAPILWQHLVAELSNLPLKERVERVNDFFNRVPYVTAESNWGDPSYWETPYEFLMHGGQCQDYAIAKYLALRESGVSEDAILFVVVHDGDDDVDHAITVVNIDGEPVALDSQLSKLTRTADLTERYSPYYSVNDAGWWLYGRQTASADSYSVHETRASHENTPSYFLTFTVAAR
jgi:predicted transglutaminase-like cysteine proteinase